MKAMRYLALSLIILILAVGCGKKLHRRSKVPNQPSMQ